MKLKAKKLKLLFLCFLLLYCKNYNSSSDVLDDYWERYEHVPLDQLDSYDILLSKKPTRKGVEETIALLAMEGQENGDHALLISNRLISMLPNFQEKQKRAWKLSAMFQVEVEKNALADPKIGPLYKKILELRRQIYALANRESEPKTSTTKISQAQAEAFALNETRARYPQYAQDNSIFEHYDSRVYYQKSVFRYADEERVETKSVKPIESDEVIARKITNLVKSTADANGWSWLFPMEFEIKKLAEELFPDFVNKDLLPTMHSGSMYLGNTSNRIIFDEHIKMFAWTEYCIKNNVHVGNPKYHRYFALQQINETIIKAFNTINNESGRARDLIAAAKFYFPTVKPAIRGPVPHYFEISEPKRSISPFLEFWFAGLFEKGNTWAERQSKNLPKIDWSRVTNLFKKQEFAYENLGEPLVSFASPTVMTHSDLISNTPKELMDISGEAPAFTFSNSGKKASFFGFWKNVRPNDLRPYTIPQGQSSSLKMTSTAHIQPINNWISIPSPDEHMLTKIELFDENNNPLPTPKISRHKQGGFVIEISKPVKINVEFQGGFSSLTQSKNVTLSWSRIEELIPELQQIGLTTLAKNLQKAKAKEISLEKLGNIFRTSNKYVYTPENYQLKAPEGNPFANFAPFVDNGVLCAQCDGTNALFTAFVNEALPKNSEYKAVIRAGFSTSDLTLKWSTLHAQTLILHNGEPLQVIDVTPSDKVSPLQMIIDKFIQFNAKWFSKSKEESTKTPQVEKVTSPAEDFAKEAAVEEQTKVERDAIEEKIKLVNVSMKIAENDAQINLQKSYGTLLKNNRREMVDTLERFRGSSFSPTSPTARLSRIMSEYLAGNFTFDQTFDVLLKEVPDLQLQERTQAELFTKVRSFATQRLRTLNKYQAAYKARRVSQRYVHMADPEVYRTFSAVLMNLESAGDNLKIQMKKSPSFPCLEDIKGDIDFAMQNVN